MICNESEGAAEEVIPELQDCPLDGQRLPLYRSVPLFRGGQLSAYVDHRVFLAVMDLGEDGSQPGVGCVRLHQEGTVKVGRSEYRLRREGCLYPVERLLRLGSPLDLLRLPLPGQICQGRG